MEQKKLKEPGSYTGAGIAIGSGVGVALGVALNNIAIGFALGIGVGIAIGAALEEQAKKRGELRELTPEEKSKKNKAAWVAFAAGFVIAFLVVLAYFFLA